MNNHLEFNQIKFMDIQMEEWSIHGQKLEEESNFYKKLSTKKNKIQIIQITQLTNKLNTTYLNLLTKL